jgi:hypothetical protein
VQEVRVTAARAQMDQRMQEAAAANAQRVELAEAQRRETCYRLYRRPDC